MSTYTVTARQRQKIDTSTNWTNNNPILLLGEIGIESNTGKLKVGNGSSRWNVLGYIGITTEYIEANYVAKNTNVSASLITINQNSNLGNATNLQAALNYIANVFAGTQKVSKLSANIFDT